MSFVIDFLRSCSFPPAVFDTRVYDTKTALKNLIVIVDLILRPAANALNIRIF